MDPGPISNFMLLRKCPHGRFRANAGKENLASVFVSIPSSCFDILVQIYGGGPRYVASDLFPCPDCLGEAKERTQFYRSVIDVDSRAIGSDGKWYLISSSWMSRWLKHIRNDGPHPGPIDLKDLFADEEYKIAKRGLRVGHDYRGVNVDVWTLLFERYGGHEPLTRKKIQL